MYIHAWNKNAIEKSQEGKRVVRKRDGTNGSEGQPKHLNQLAGKMTIKMAARKGRIPR